MWRWHIYMHSITQHIHTNLCYLSVNNREPACSTARGTPFNKRQPRRLSLTVSCSFGEIHRGSSSGWGIPVVCTVNWRGQLVSRCGCRPVINVVFEESLVVAWKMWYSFCSYLKLCTWRQRESLAIHFLEWVVNNQISPFSSPAKTMENRIGS